MSSETPERLHFAAVDPATGGGDTIVTGFAEGGIVHLDRSRAPYEALATVQNRLERRYDRAPNGCRECGAEQRGHGDEHPYADPGDALRLARMKHRRDAQLNRPLRLRPITDLIMTFTVDTSTFTAAMDRVIEAMLPLVEAERARQDAITTGELPPDNRADAVTPFDLAAANAALDAEFARLIPHPAHCRCSILPLGDPCTAVLGDGVHNDAPGIQAAIDRASARTPAVDPELEAARHWPAPSRAVRAHVCGPDAGHSCDARATTSLRFELPSGGARDLPLCGPCAGAENAATGGSY